MSLRDGIESLTRFKTYGVSYIPNKGLLLNQAVISKGTDVWFWDCGDAVGRVVAKVNTDTDGKKFYDLHCKYGNMKEYRIPGHLVGFPYENRELHAEERFTKAQLVALVGKQQRRIKRLERQVSKRETPTRSSPCLFV